MDKKIICLLLLFIFSSCNISKNTTGLKSNKVHPTFLQTETFGIRVKPILNREYLIFLSWYISVYGESYPEKVINILPKESLNPDYNSNFELPEILQASTSILKNYIFNPKYIDYPLIGLSTTQVSEMQRWMSDRYNENVLIDKGFMHFNPNQKDEDSFATESFLVNQYVGDVRKNNSSGPFDDGNRFWRKEYLPVLRLPYQNEINSIKNHSDFSTNLKKYSFGKKDFLWKWNNHFLTILPSENKIIIKHPYVSTEIISKNNFNPNNTFTDAILNDKKIEFTNTRYLDLGNPDGEKDQYQEYPYPEKNRSGQMEFVVVAIDTKNRPIIADVLKLKNEDFSENKIFRIAFNKILEPQYLPK